jgi:(E)-4-hydroxy-3-methylbut-2-enyl-diphosphate synthase
LILILQTDTETRLRLKTRVVNIGDVPLGGNYPIRVQSMTTTNTLDTKATVEQSIRIIQAGSDYVRITAPSMKEAVNLENIKKELRARGYNTPLIADIHFTPNAAEHAARIVEKVRVNPGNYADRKRFKIFQYSDEMYNSELERIRERFTPLVRVCKEYGTAMRIGTNHGSLSDRIMNRYGDTPLGMVESALEFVRICEDLGYCDIVLSMKASNPRVMIEAYRLLVQKMKEEGMNYPIHLGVTEAGDGMDARVKSAVGMGTLLEEGIGDTVRVSLTEEPEFEIPVALALVKPYNDRFCNSRQSENPVVAHNVTLTENQRTTEIVPLSSTFEPQTSNSQRRLTNSVGNIGGHHVPVVIISLLPDEIHNPQSLKPIGYIYNKETDKWTVADTAPDYIYLGKSDIPYTLLGSVKKIFDNGDGQFRSGDINFLSTTVGAIHELPTGLKNSVIILNITDSNLSASEAREMFRNTSAPVILYAKYDISPLSLGEGNGESYESPLSLGEGIGERLLLRASTDFGRLLIDGFGDGIWIDFLVETGLRPVSAGFLNHLSFAILQATRTRISKTEYIACPSCGRTQFDLVETTQMIRAKTSHLKGIKIAIMGCIVNGPGEMADADYGFVGSGPGWVTLYRGKEVIERGISYEKALDKLIGLMKEDGNWAEPA